MLKNRSAQQFISVQELKDDGYSHYKIGKLVESGKLAGVNKRYYENLTYNGEPNDFYATTAYSEKSTPEADTYSGGPGMAGYEILSFFGTAI